MRPGSIPPVGGDGYHAVQWDRSAVDGRTAALPANVATERLSMVIRHHIDLRGRYGRTHISVCVWVGHPCTLHVVLLGTIVLQYWLLLVSSFFM